MTRKALEQQNRYEYLIHTWGGFYNQQHVEKHGLKPGFFWFKSADARKLFLDNLQKIERELNATHLAFSLAEGEGTRQRTVAKMTLEYNGVRVNHEENFGYGYASEAAEYMFHDGNYSCDCNLSNMMRKYDSTVPKLECGSQIQIIDFEVVYSERCEQDFCYER